MLKKVVLDTNFLLIPGQLGVDIFEEIRKCMDVPYELYIVSGTLDELDIIEKDKNRTAARIARELLKQHKVAVIPSTGHVDDVLAELSEDCIIATQDAGLKRRLKGKKLVLRQKKYIELI